MNPVREGDGGWWPEDARPLALNLQSIALPSRNGKRGLG
jgi:hypothetical protein